MVRVAGIDCGTNSIRLLVADAVTADGARADAARTDAAAAGSTTRLEDVHREMRVVRLGQGVDATGMLAPEALERTFTAADDYAATVRSLGAERVRFVATSAMRDAGNRDEFVEGIRERFGVDPEIVAGTEEAALSFAGAASVLALEEGRPVLVVDLGGGSTEFVLGDARGVIAAASIDMGCVRLTERHLHSDPPTPDEIAAAERDVDAGLARALAGVALGEATAIIGVAGSITTITAHALRLPTYQPERIHAAELTIGQITDACADLLALTRGERAALPYMHPGRVDVIGAGALVWRRILARVSELTGGAITTAVTSEHDILDGIALSTLAESAS
ncbi:Ppx/GppA phosphatase family protein [Sinomonas sp. ASV486]|uniref:Ppx/GppA phosphatase family protein n=1 Tax=Sinomonas sp. ASV486 TaxID=3051170 RepID=UPI0027DD13D5|nr:Ppx/GppA phosphatase family protein [Sinomonas sp. ASV486]MDQ4490267.1 Ppx/GppA phosphatase family protein [Sinomonas sp. ASV486]